MQRSLALVLPVAALLAAGAGAQTCVPDPAGDLDLTVAPTLALPGQPVDVTLANASATCTYTLLSTCLYEVVRTEQCDGDPVRGFACGDALTPIPPGASVTMTWDQKSDAGAQVADGLYRFPVTVVGEDGVKTELCAFVQVGTGCTSPLQYGFASAGAGGLAPAISSLGGPPQVGGSAFAVAVTSAVGGAPAACFVSLGAAELGLGFGTVFVDPALVVFSQVMLLGGAPSAPGQGIGVFPIAIPNVPALVGLEAYAQVFVADAAAAGGLAHTEGLRLAVCP